MNERTITICDKQVTMRYCAAAETGYEELSGKSSEVFIPRAVTNEDGTVSYEKPEANMQDFIWLALASIIASYSCRHEKPPVTTEEIMYEATPDNIKEMITAIVQLRNDWYHVSDVVEKSPENTDNSKN